MNAGVLEMCVLRQSVTVRGACGERGSRSALSAQGPGNGLVRACPSGPSALRLSLWVGRAQLI